MPLTLILQITNNNDLCTQANQNEKNQDIPNGAGGSASGGKVDRSIKNLLITSKLAKSKKPKLTKPKKSDFEKTNSSGTDFLIFKAKKIFIHLQKTFTNLLILRHFDLKCHIQIETDALGYVISEILSQLTSNQYSSYHVTHKDPYVFKSGINQ